MEPLQLPSDEEINTAYDQGLEAVLALFHGTAGQLADRVRRLEDWTSKNSPPLLDEADQSAEGRPAQDAKTAAQNGGGPRPIQQGDVYWVPLGGPVGDELGYPHPQVVIQDNIFNRSRINTVVVCALTSNRKRASAPGNVLLDAGEANLPRPSVVEVSKLATVDKSQLSGYIGTLTQPRIQQILAGIQFLQVLMDHHDSGEES